MVEICVKIGKALLYLGWEKWTNQKDQSNSGWSVKKMLKFPQYAHLSSPVLGN